MEPRPGKDVRPGLPELGAQHAEARGVPRKHLHQPDCAGAREGALERRLILVRRSGERTATIGGHADAVPIHSELASSCRRPVGNAPRGGEVHIYCYWLLGSLGQVHAYQMTSSVNIISIRPNMV